METRGRPQTAVRKPLERDEAQSRAKLVERPPLTRAAAQGSGTVVQNAFRPQPRRTTTDFEERPWGTFETVDRGERYRVKRIVVKPGGQLSLQMHYHRAEHWIIVAGAAIVTRDNTRLLARENEAIFIPVGMRHRIENPGKTPLVLVEVQLGAYLEEDDIVRFEDRYGRG
jgi:mannose-6-phosphate isomerase-like protein (cupin superfamily)